MSSLVPYDPFRHLDNPFRQFDSWRREMDRVFAETFPTVFTHAMNMPRLDVYETDNEVVASFEIPGVEKKEDIQIDADNNVLTVSGNINRTTAVDEEAMHRRERYVGRFQRSVALPARIDAEGIKATYRNGVLEVRMPKAAPDNRRHIDVEFH